MFSIRKKYKIQPYFYNEKLWSGQVLTDFTNADSHMPESAVDVARLQIGKKLRWTLHDIYTIPSFEDIWDIYKFISELEWEEGSKNQSEFKNKAVKDLILAYNLSVKYLQHEWYYIPKMWHPPKQPNDLMKILKRWQGYQNTREKIAYCTILKEVLCFFRIIRYKNFKVNHETGEIDLRDKEFINRIITIFWSSEFQYDQPDSQKFSWSSSEMHGTTIIDWKKIELYAGFWVKSVYALIEKMDWQEKYHLPEAFNDIHRMRIEVKDSDAAIRIGKLLFEKFGWWLSIENSGLMIEESMAKEYCDSYLTTDLHEEYWQTLLSNFLWDKSTVKKAYSEKRQELKLTRKWDMPIEIQIVLVNNNNESGYAHHDVYKIRRKIAAKIRRHGWISVKDINTILDMVIRDNESKNKWKSTIPFNKDQLLKHIMGLKWFLMPIRWASEWDEWNINKWGKIRINHYSTKEVLEKYQKNYPEYTKKDPIYLKTYDPISEAEWLIGLSKLSFPPTS